MGKSSFKGHHRCPNCNGKLSYNVEKEIWTCEYCDSVFVEEQLEDKKYKLANNFLDVFKKLGTGYLVLIGIIVVAVISVIVIVLVNMFKIVDESDNKYDQVENSETEDVVDDYMDDFLDVMDKQKVHSFNSTFEMRSGTKSGFFVKNLFDDIVTNNKTNKEHIVTLVFNENKTSDVDNIIDLKKSLSDSTEYEVILDYDDNGYVYMITVK